MTSQLIWANLLHLSVNMWNDVPPQYSEELRFDVPLWNELTERMADSGFNMVVIDVGDAVQLQSHPEIAVRNAWSPERLREELTRLRGLGLEPIPKLNFSTGHDIWLKEYSYQVSTPVYYQVTADVIAEVAELFDTPRFFHIGMDEETAQHQRRQQLAIMRQHDLWWHDLNYLADKVTEAGSRPWIWSDHAWRIPDEFYQRMPKSILQSNWYYGPGFDTDPSGRPRELGSGEYHLAYLDLNDNGYDQIPTGSTWSCEENFERTVEYCAKHVDPARLLGFLQTPWLMTVPEHRETHLLAIDVVKRAKDKLESQ